MFAVVNCTCYANLHLVKITHTWQRVTKKVWPLWFFSFPLWYYFVSYCNTNLDVKIMDDRIYTYGVEEEYLCTNREDTAPFNLPDEIWEKTPAFMRTGREAHRCVIETMSHVCKTKNELNTHLLKSRAWLSKSIEHYGGKIYAGGTHHTID